MVARLMVMAALRSLAFSSDRIDFTHIAVTVVANTPRTRATTETSAIALRILRSRWRCVMSP